MFKSVRSRALCGDYRPEVCVLNSLDGMYEDTGLLKYILGRDYLLASLPAFRKLFIAANYNNWVGRSILQD